MIHKVTERAGGLGQTWAWLESMTFVCQATKGDQLDEKIQQGFVKNRERLGNKLSWGVSACFVSLTMANLVVLEQPPSGLLDDGNTQAVEFGNTYVLCRYKLTPWIKLDKKDKPLKLETRCTLLIQKWWSLSFVAMTRKPMTREKTAAGVQTKGNFRHCDNLWRWRPLRV